MVGWSRARGRVVAVDGRTGRTPGELSRGSGVMAKRCVGPGVYLLWACSAGFPFQITEGLRAVSSLSTRPAARLEMGAPRAPTQAPIGRVGAHSSPYHPATGRFYVADRVGTSKTRCGIARARYGTQRRRFDPKDNPFADRQITEPLEITSRVSTDDVAKAKQRLDEVFGRDAEPVDVALATNMISVGWPYGRSGSA